MNFFAKILSKICYGFQDINIFCFSAKIQDGRQKLAKIEIFQFCIEYFATTLWVKNSVEIALSLTVSEILILFVFRKNSSGRQKWRKLNFFNFTEYSATTLWAKNSVEIALSITVSKILTFFVFLQKFKMAAKSGEN